MPRRAGVAITSLDEVQQPTIDVTIGFSGEPTQETYEFLADYIEPWL
jgi:hypothetical protein